MTKHFWWWLAGSTALILFWPSILYAGMYGIPLRAHGEMFGAHLILVLSHLLAGLVLSFIWRRRPDLRLWEYLAVVLSVLGIGLLVLLISLSPFSRLVVLGTEIISVASFLAIYVSKRIDRPGIQTAGAVAITGLAVLVIAVAMMRPRAEQEVIIGEREEWSVQTAFYPLRVTEIIDPFPTPESRGGGIERVGDGWIVVTGDGRIYAGKLSENDLLELNELPTQAPLNRADFDVDAPEKITREFFRVTDILVLESPAASRLLVSHHYWKRDQQCYVLRVSQTDWARSGTAQLEEGNLWDTLFESQPCIGFERDSVRAGQLMMGGGRMQRLSEDELLLTVGDHGFDKEVVGPLYPQINSASYGKTIRIRLSSGAADIFTSGHRNQQGLLVTDNGRIWSTEHGPRGGDELNAIVQGRNYGWPFATYGTNYQAYEWVKHEQPHPSDSLFLPVYSWVPSVGISSLIESQSPLFPAWNGDLLVASLKAGLLFRVHIQDERAVVTEPIRIGGRIRDLIEDADGRIVLWMDTGAFIVVQPEDSGGTGISLFARYCSTCHSLAAGDTQLIGPHLESLIGRPIASVSGYQYSAALREMSGTWTEENLRLFLANPGSFAPGTTMDFPGIQSDEELERLVTYLREND